MTADHWTYCLQCVRRADKAQEEQRQQVRASYGEIPIEQFEVARMAAAIDHELRDDERLFTFREDWDQGVETDGTMFVKYSGRCSECNWGIDFEHTEVLSFEEGL